MSLWPTSAAFNTALASDRRRWFTQVEIMQQNQVLATLNTVADGSVTLAETSTRRTCDLTLVDPSGTLTPTSARDLLAPLQSEVRISRGLRLAGGAVEYVPLGTFGVIDPTVDSLDGAVLIQLSGADRSDAVASRRFAEPWTVKAGTPTHQAIIDIVRSRLNVPVRVTVTGSTVPETVFEDLTSPWDAVQKIAEADGLTAYFDQLGTLVVARDEEVPTGISYNPGPDSFMLEAGRSMSADTTYSGVVVSGQHPDNTPVRVVAWDNDPKSPTYYQGPFGARPFGFNSPLITSAAMANAAAATLLRRVTKMRQKVTVRTVGHPGHDIGDVIHVEHPLSRINGNYVITGARIPLRIGSISLTALEAA